MIRPEPHRIVEHYSKPANQYWGIFQPIAAKGGGRGDTVIVIALRVNKFSD